MNKDNTTLVTCRVCKVNTKLWDLDDLGPYIPEQGCAYTCDQCKNLPREEKEATIMKPA